jgi:FkbM family methyltransferase
MRRRPAEQLVRRLGHRVFALAGRIRTRLESRRMAAVLLVLGHPGPKRRSALGRAYIAQEVLREPVVFTDRFDVQMLLYPSDDLIDRYANEGYNERREQDFCVSYLKPGMTTFDVGANYGLYALLFAHCVGADSVHAFEAESWNFQRLTTNLALNGATQVQAHCCAVTEASGEVQLTVYPREQFGWHTLGTPDLEVDGAPYPPQERRTVPAISIDDYCSQHGIGQIDLLKVDVEGAELEVLRGAQRMLGEGRVPCVLFEVSEAMLEGMGHSGDEVFDLLREHGYALHAFADDGSLMPAPQRPTDHYANFVALR